MHVLRDLPENSDPSAVTIGVFDGVHLGHQLIVGRMVEHARQNELRATVVTFDPHPALLLRPESAPKLLSTLESKLARLETLGVDRTVVLPFTPDISTMEPETFVDRILVHSLNASRVVIGANFHFGANRGGNVDDLIVFGARSGFDVEVVDLARLDGMPEPVSSTAIRRALAGGRVSEATTMLGRPFAITGEVLMGDQRGRTIGFPTANVPVSRDRAWPADGVYAGWLTASDDVRRPCAINIGKRPTFYQHAEHSLLEAHVLDFDGDLYGDFVRVEFAEFIRSERRFDGIDDLARQLKLDTEQARRILDEYP
ncbi:MAG: bifunctional riboflavin kinase/FAD synthetase [Acidimicrobiales bacterium]